MGLTKTLLLLLSLNYLDRSVFAASSYFVSPDDLIHQIVPPGAPWPANQAGYLNFNQMAEAPLPVVTIVPARIEVTTTAPEIPNPLVAISLPNYVSPSKRPDFPVNTWGRFSSTERYWLQDSLFK